MSKFKIYGKIHWHFNIFAGTLIRWYVIKYTLDNKKHNEILRLMAKSIIDILHKFSKWMLNKVKVHASDEFWEEFRRFNREYFQ